MPTLAMSVGQVGPTGVVFSEPTAFLDLFYKTRTYDYTRLDGPVAEFRSSPCPILDSTTGWMVQ